MYLSKFNVLLPMNIGSKIYIQNRELLLIPMTLTQLRATSNTFNVTAQGLITGQEDV